MGVHRATKPVVHDTSSFEAQTHYQWHVLVVITYAAILALYCQFAALTWFFSRLRGRLRLKV